MKGAAMGALHNFLSPDSSYSIHLEDAIGADNWPACRLRLRRQHAVKGIVVMSRQQASPDRVRGIDGEFGKTLNVENLVPARQQDLGVKLPDIGFDCKFPWHDGGNDHGICRRINCASCWGRQTD